MSSELWVTASSFKMNECIQPGWTDSVYFFHWKRKAYLCAVWSVVMDNNKTTDPFHLLESIPVGTVNKKPFHSCRELSVIQTGRLLSVSLKQSNFLAGWDATLESVVQNEISIFLSCTDKQLFSFQNVIGNNYLAWKAFLSSVVIKLKINALDI